MFAALDQCVVNHTDLVFRNGQNKADAHVEHAVHFPLGNAAGGGNEVENLREREVCGENRCPQTVRQHVADAAFQTAGDNVGDTLDVELAAGAQLHNGGR